MKDKELQVNKSNIFSMPENKRYLKNPSSTAGTKSVISFDCKKNADVHLKSVTQERCVMLTSTNVFTGLSIVECLICMYSSTGTTSNPMRQNLEPKW
jgi:hypothetical protein